MLEPLMIQDRYLNPFTDFGFKKLFGTEANKDLLIDFLNSLFQGEEIIKTLEFKKQEQLGESEIDRRAIFDLYCENDKGEKFIIELQKAKQKYFKERTLFYSTFPIQEQNQRGDWDFNLKAVYLVAILDFIFDEDKNDPLHYRYVVQLTDIDTKKVFYDKLTFIYLEMPKFNKKSKELVTHFDKWMYALKALPTISESPEFLEEEIFKKLFQISAVQNLSPEEKERYESSLKFYRDTKNVIDTAREEGRIEGEAIGIRKTAKNLLALGLTHAQISQATGLSVEEIAKL
jgi:predicted transposase/invertase (TIGR01784 family)